MLTRQARRRKNVLRLLFLSLVRKMPTKVHNFSDTAK